MARKPRLRQPDYGQKETRDAASRDISSGSGVLHPKRNWSRIRPSAVYERMVEDGRSPTVNIRSPDPNCFSGVLFREYVAQHVWPHATLGLI